MQMILRNFDFDRGLWLRIANRSAANELSTQELARKYLDDFLADPVLVEGYDVIDNKMFFTIYLSVEQDIALTSLAKTLGKSKGYLFRTAMSRRMGVMQRPISPIVEKSIPTQPDDRSLWDRINANGDVSNILLQALLLPFVVPMAFIRYLLK